MRKIRVAMIITAYYPVLGGAERQLGVLAPYLQAQNVDVHILTRRRPGLAIYEEIDNVPVHRLHAPPPKPLASLVFTLDALRQIRTLKPDVIHAHSLFSPSTVAILARRLFGIPILAKLLRGGEKGDLDNLRSRPSGAWRIPYLMRHIDGFAVISKEIDQELQEAGVPTHRRHYVPNGVDIQRFQPLSSVEKSALRQKLGFSNGPIGIFTGRLVPVKRVDRLIEIWPQVRVHHNDANLLILGSGIEAPTLRSKAGPGVHILGNKDDVVPYLQIADFFVLPSSTEGLSNAMLEAMAMGLPIIVTQVGGASDLIEHGKRGWLIEPDNNAMLYETILHVLSNPVQAQEAGQNARDYILQEYTIERVAQRLYTIYGELSHNNINRS